MNKGQRTKSKEQIIWLLFTIVIIAVYFFGLSIPLLGPDEARYAQVAREMYLRGDLVTPTLGGFNWFEKPVLLYWLQIFSYKLFGVSEFAARFGSAISGLATILSLYILGKTVSSEKTTNNEQRTTSKFANWLALISASSIGLLAFARGASFDIILTFPITASLVSFFIFDQSKKKSGFTFYFLLFTFYFFIGVALLAKGLVGIVFPLAIIAFYFVLSRKLPTKTFIFSLFWGTIISILVACLWYLPMYRAHGWTFVDEFFVQHHFQRFTSNKYQHPQPFYFFFWVLPLMTIPWLPFFLASIWDFFKRFFHHRGIQKNAENNIKLSTLHSPLSAFGLAWLLVPLVFFSFSGSKLPGYILPALPAALILTAEYIWRFVQKSEKRK
ncbi:MAG: glycosyltransferase family 39 protein, partial [Acidobacteriota bacterium]|nr:glycosyltransferase family 39 protein [Acidobacteriota bacterium]